MLRMLYTSVLLATLLSSTAAFPSMASMSSEYGNHGHGVKIIYPERMSFTGSKMIPDKHHPYIPPGPGDQRGPCPGLNTLANHGYLPRNGIVSVQDLINGAQEGFNMGYDFAKAVSSFALLSRGNPLLNKVSLGGESHLIPPLPGKIDGIPGGLAKHGRFEGDVSMTRQDAALGDHVKLNPDLYNNLLSYVDRFGEDNGTVVTYKVFSEYRWDRLVTLNKTNPQLTYHNGRRGFGYGEAGLILNLFPNFKEGNLSLPVMKTFLEQERFPENWYRRNTTFEFEGISIAADTVEEAHPNEAGAKDASGTFVAENIEYNPFYGTACAIYYDLAGLNLAAPLVNTTGLTRKNVDTLLEGIHALFKPFDCPRLDPIGPAMV
jgi:hypothetical protein